MKNAHPYPLNANRSKPSDQWSNSKTRVLLTGFEAFGDDPSGLKLNPSAMIAKNLGGICVNSYEIESIILPCEYQRSVKVLKKALREYAPHMVICLGQAGGKSAIQLERIAHNWDCALLADNAGEQRSGQKILKTAPEQVFSTLPMEDLQQALTQANIPVEISESAGNFVCNHVFFHLMRALRPVKTAQAATKIRAGFIHVPYLPEQSQNGALPSMPLETMQRGIEIVIENLIDNP